MPELNDQHRRHDTDRTQAPSLPSAADETGAATERLPAAAAPAFGPPVRPGEVGTLGPYRLVRLLGKGGMGGVYAALDTRLDRRLALKLMLPEFAADPAARERFVREARAAAKVAHDNVVTVYEADERDGMPYIAMQFLAGYPLDEYLNRKGNPTVAQVLRIGRDAAAGLAAAHRLGLVHRDIKPANLWLEAPHGRVKVLDFGLARPVDAAVELTKSGTIVGTPAYMSPEQARGLKVDHRTDLFSLGAVLYRLVTGRLPFPGDSTMGVLMALGTEEPTPVRELNPAAPVALADLIHQLLSKLPANRPASADEVAARLRALAAAPAPAAPAQPVVDVPIQVSAAEANPLADLDATEADSVPAALPAGAPRKPRGATRAVAAGLAALVLMVLGGVIIIIRNRDGTETKIEVPDGATVTVKGKDGKTLAKVGPGTGKAPAADDDPHRKAAEWVLSVGGTVRVNGRDNDISRAADLPAGRFVLSRAGLTGRTVADAGLAHLTGLRGLTDVNLTKTGVGDAGLAQLRGSPDLEKLVLHDTGVTDAGLTDIRLRFPRVRNLGLANTKLTDKGLAEVAGLSALRYLGVAYTAVTDAGVAQFRGHATLSDLTLNGTKVTDAGLAHLHACPALVKISVKNTKVTAAGLARFHAAVPGCQIEHDGGVIEAKK